MAERTEGHTFTRNRRRHGKYPWSDWTDGSQWVIYRGEDYAISTYNMQISLHGRAKNQDKTVKSESFMERHADAQGFIRTREGLIFQFFDKETK